MPRIQWNWTILLALAVACCQLPRASADEPRKEGAARTGDAHSQHFEQHVASCLILDNQNEVTLGALAEHRSRNSEVQKFAQQMQKDHSDFISKLEKFGGQDLRQRLQAANDTAAANKDRSKANAERTNPAKATATTAAGGNRADDDRHLQIKREIADECLASARAELDSKQGAEFDACYIGMQLGAHMHMIDTLKVLERHTSGDLHSLLAKGRATAEEHLSHAKKIMKDIDHLKTAESSKTTRAK